MFVCPACCAVRAVFFFYFVFFVVLFPHVCMTDCFVGIHAVQKNMSTCLSQNNLWWKFFALLMSLGRLTVEQVLPAERVEFPNERILHM